MHHKLWHTLLVIIEHLIKAPIHFFEGVIILGLGVMILTSKVPVFSLLVGLPILICGIAFILIALQDTFGGMFNRGYQEAECPFCREKQTVLKNGSIQICINCKEKFSLENRL